MMTKKIVMETLNGAQTIEGITVKALKQALEKADFFNAIGYADYPEPEGRF